MQFSFNGHHELKPNKVAPQTFIHQINRYLAEPTRSERNRNRIKRQIINTVIVSHSHVVLLLYNSLITAQFLIQ